MFKRDDIPTPPVWLALIPVLVTAILCWIAGIIALAFGYMNITMHKCKPTEEEEEDQQ